VNLLRWNVLNPKKMASAHSAFPINITDTKEGYHYRSYLLKINFSRKKVLLNA